MELTVLKQSKILVKMRHGKKFSACHRTNFGVTACRSSILSEPSGPILNIVSEIFHAAKAAALWHGHVCAGRNHLCYLLSNSISISNDSVSWYGAWQRFEIR